MRASADLLLLVTGGKPMSDASTTQLQVLVDRLATGDPTARNELINRSCERLRRIAHKELKRFPGVRRWEDTDDVLQNAALRLWRDLERASPQSVRHFIGLAAMHIRRELIDLVRHHYGPEGLGANYQSSSASTNAPRHDRPTDTHNPSRLAEWAELHERIAGLPDEERELFDLFYYHDVPQAEAATILGVDERTVRRRWQAARLKFREALRGESPL